jgi:hypothetical protein
MPSRQSNKKIQFLLTEIENKLANTSSDYNTWTLEHIAMTIKCFTAPFCVFRYFLREFGVRLLVNILFLIKQLSATVFIFFNSRFFFSFSDPKVRVSFCHQCCYYK